MKKSHLLIMILCCLVPVVGFAAIYFLKVPVNSVLLLGVILICPVTHIVMMKFVGSSHAHGATPKASADCHAQPDEIHLMEK